MMRARFESRAMRTASVLLILALSFLLSSSVASAQRAAQGWRRIQLGLHDRIVFQKPIKRVAVGNPDVLWADVLESRELILLGKSTGRTSVMVWFTDGGLESIPVEIRPDLTVLERALRDVHDSLTVELAPDRVAVVLRGRVPDVTYANAAVQAAEDYLRAGAGAGGRRRVAAPIVKDPSAAKASESSEERLRAAPVAPATTSVINLIRVDELPPRLDEQVQKAIRSLGANDVVVERFRRGLGGDDTRDVIVLSGHVETQIMLTRVLHLVSRLVLGNEAQNADIDVLADEAGALLGSNQTTASRNQNPLRGGAGGGAGGGRNFGNQSFLPQGRLRDNIGRATALSVAAGRILSFIEVEDVPQIRVAIRLVEVNRTQLLGFDANLVGIVSDFNQPSLEPAVNAAAIQGDNAARVGSFNDTDVQNVLGFLGGTFTNTTQLSGEHGAVDLTLRALESRGIARTLASPTLTVLSGEFANFLAGGDVPVSQFFSPTGQGAQGVFGGVTFEQFGVQLSVRPRVGTSDQLTIDLLAQVARPDEQLTAALRAGSDQNVGAPAFQTRSLNTVARLGDGDALLVGGLMSREANDQERGVPILQDIPLLGWLFKGYQIEEDDIELIVIVNPVIVREPIPDLDLWSFPDARDALPGRQVVAAAAPRDATTEAPQKTRAETR